ncbi:MAG: hypothetical protein KAI47_25195, partial [Deltaproteobacteria bacterium]|nr:hypothetical protein [Deltaproteobacteria bacterium]
MTHGEVRARTVAAFALAMVGASFGASGCAMSRAEGDLSAGRYEAVLREVHGTGARTYRLRGMAYAGLGKTDAALRALRISRKLDGTSVVTLRSLATIEARLGLVGAALRDLHRAFALDPVEPPKLRRLYARLLVLRGTLRLEPKRHIGGRDLGLRDLARARTLDPTIATAMSPTMAGSTPTIAAQTAALHARHCPGLPVDLPLATPASLHGATPASLRKVTPGQGTRGARCRLTKPRSLIVALRRRDVLLACHGAATARRLEAVGCFAVAIELWRAMQAEGDPHDPRWALHVGRVEVARDRLSAARMAFEEHIYLLGTKVRAAGALAA